MADYGTDVSTFVINDEGVNDLDPFFREISGLRVIAEAVARRWTSEKGSMFWDPDAGENVRNYLNAKFDPSNIVDLQASLAHEAEKDERVANCAVLVTYEQAIKRLRIRGRITPSDGPVFEFVMPVDSVTGEVLGLELAA
jgi:hypothetical protein